MYGPWPEGPRQGERCCCLSSHVSKQHHRKPDLKMLQPKAATLSSYGAVPRKNKMETIITVTGSHGEIVRALN